MSVVGSETEILLEADDGNMTTDVTNATVRAIILARSQDCLNGSKSLPYGTAGPSSSSNQSQGKDIKDNVMFGLQSTPSNLD